MLDKQLVIPTQKLNQIEQQQLNQRRVPILLNDRKYAIEQNPDIIVESMFGFSDSNHTQICLGMWTLKKLNKIVGYIQKWDTKKLLLYQNKYQPLVKEISHIEFRFLSLINLQDNFIQSVQDLAYSKMPNLQTLNIRNNRLTSIESIRKTNYPKLKKLHYANNMIKDSMTKIYQHDSVLTQIIVQYSFDNSEQIEDTRYLAFKTKGRSEIGANSMDKRQYRRIYVKQQRQALLKKRSINKNAKTQQQIVINRHINSINC